MEHPKGESLREFLIKKHERRISEKDAHFIFVQVLNVLEFLSQYGISHRNINLKNVFITKEGTVKLGDFLLCNRIGPIYKPNASTSSYHFYAPEIWLEDSHHNSSDIWSVGVLLYVMVCGLYPFFGRHEFDIYLNGKRGQFMVPSHISDSCSNLIKLMLTPNPYQRPTIYDVKNHPWVNGQAQHSNLVHPLTFNSSCITSPPSISSPGTHSPFEYLDPNVSSPPQLTGILSPNQQPRLQAPTQSKIPRQFPPSVRHSLMSYGRSFSNDEGATLDFGLSNNPTPTPFDSSPLPNPLPPSLFQQDGSNYDFILFPDSVLVNDQNNSMDNSINSNSNNNSSNSNNNMEIASPPPPSSSSSSNNSNFTQAIFSDRASIKEEKLKRKRSTSFLNNAVNNRNAIISPTIKSKAIRSKAKRKTNTSVDSFQYEDSSPPPKSPNLGVLGSSPQTNRKTFPNRPPVSIESFEHISLPSDHPEASNSSTSHNASGMKTEQVNPYFYYSNQRQQNQNHQQQNQTLNSYPLGSQSLFPSDSNYTLFSEGSIQSYKVPLQRTQSDDISSTSTSVSDDLSDCIHQFFEEFSVENS